MAPFILTAVIKRLTPLCVNAFTSAFVLITFERLLLIVFVVKSTFIVDGGLFNILVGLRDILVVVEV